VPDARLVGRFQEPHVIELTFAEPISPGTGTPMLIADGWAVYPNAQSTIAAFQAGKGFQPPRLDARNADGTWITIYPEFGYPAGMQRQMSLPLTGLPKSCRVLRITTELQVYWDCFRVAFEEPCPQVQKSRLETKVCRLSRVGSPRYTPNTANRPFDFDYNDRNLFWPSRSPTGFYTQFGECGELVSEADDAVATIGPGEELHLEFAETKKSPPGWSRRLVLESRGWCRGMRIYTRNGQQVEPLPTTGQPSERRQELHRRFHTRWVGS
jgi:hypothetical protein